MFIKWFAKICLLFSLFILNACDDINQTYDKKFDVYTMYKDLTIIENGNVLRMEDVRLLKNYIDRKILCDSIYWLKKFTYHELFNYAARSAIDLSMGSPEERAWKINSMLNIKLTNFSPDDGQLSFTFQNNSGKDIKSFRAEVRLFTLSNTKIGQIDLNYQDTLRVGKIANFLKTDIVAFRLDKYNLNEIVVKPNVRRVVFMDTTQFVNPLGTIFDE